MSGGIFDTTCRLAPLCQDRKFAAFDYNLGHTGRDVNLNPGHAVYGKMLRRKMPRRIVLRGNWILLSGGCFAALIGRAGGNIILPLAHPEPRPDQQQRGQYRRQPQRNGNVGFHQPIVMNHACSCGCVD